MKKLKKHLDPIALIVFMLPLWGQSQGCLHSTMFPNDTLNFSTTWQSVDTCSFAGEYTIFEVINGTTYEFSTSLNDGSNVMYDSQLSLINEADSVLAYNDDLSNNELQSKIQWTADFSGFVELHLSEYDCLPNTICSIIRYRETAPALLPENTLHEQIILYPNPAHDRLFISGMLEESQFEVFNANGKTTMKGLIDKINPTISVSSLPNGIYFLRISSAQRNSTFRVMKQD